MSAAPPGGRAFATYCAALGVSALGSMMAVLALPLLVLEATGSVARMGLVAAAQGASALAAGLVAGPLVDRFDRRRLLVLADLGCGVLLCGAPLWWSTVGPSFAYLVACASAASALTTLWRLSANAFLPSLVGEANVLRANARVQVILGCAQVVGPPLSGLLSAARGPVAVVGLDGLSFLASAALLVAMPAARPAPAAHEARGLRAAALGFRVVWGAPLLFWMALIDAVFFALGTSALNLLLFYLKGTLGGGDAAIGLVFGAATLGAVGAAFAVGPLRERFGFGPLWLGCIVTTGFVFLAGSRAPGLWATVAIAIVFTAAQTVANVLVLSTRQELVPEGLRGRVGAAFWVLAFALMPAGNAALALVAERAGAPAAFAVMGAVALVLALVGCATPARTRRPSAEVIEAAARSA
jgi:MFS family permease